MKKKMGVVVLRGKKHELQAPNFSFAFAKAGDECRGREGRMLSGVITKLVPSLPSWPAHMSLEVWKRYMQAAPTSCPRKI